MAVPDPLLTIEDVAKQLKVSKQRLYAWRHEGKGPPVIQLEGRLLRYSPDDLEAWITSQRENGGPRTAAASGPSLSRKASQ